MANVQVNIPSADQKSEKKKKKRPDLPVVSIKNTADYQRVIDTCTCIKIHDNI